MNIFREGDFPLLPSPEASPVVLDVGVDLSACLLWSLLQWLVQSQSVSLGAVPGPGCVDAVPLMGLCVMQTVLVEIHDVTSAVVLFPEPMELSPSGLVCVPGALAADCGASGRGDFLGPCVGVCRLSGGRSAVFLQCAGLLVHGWGGS